jgi:signal transduction histidine kinase
MDVPERVEAAPGPSTVTTGLGLLHMRERAEALGGSFRVVSEPGVGTTVEVTIPRKTGRER